MDEKQEMNANDLAADGILGMTRRAFMKTTAAAGALVAGAGSLLAGSAEAADKKKSKGKDSKEAKAEKAAEKPPRPAYSGPKKRYALVGVGGRSMMYRQAIENDYADCRELVAYCDNNLGRLQLAQSLHEAKTGAKIPIYDVSKDPKQFERMIAETKPDAVIVTTPCGFHHDYICRALEAGVGAISEKAMATNPEKCQRIIDTVKKVGRPCRVTFNYRYAPHATQVKDLLMSGVIGDVLSVDFHWMLDTTHGADYFRRWHSHKVNSGGLMIHKASHHFDLMNWWLSAIPVQVNATGKREFYTPKTAERYGLAGRGERCLDCAQKDKCAFVLDLAGNAEFKKLYLENEKYDGYFRDKCIFRQDIDIEDTMNLLVKYDTGVTMAYSLNAFNAWEGWVVAFNGTKGRLEAKCEEAVSLFGDGSVPSAVKPEGTWIKIYPIRQPAYQVEIWKGEGAHGGGDKVMLDDIFLPEPPKDKYLRNADHRAGAYSMLVGAAANRAFETGQPVEIASLVQGIEKPDYPQMPGHDEPIPMPTTKSRTATAARPRAARKGKKGKPAQKA